MAFRRISFLSDGFADVLNSAGVVAETASAARKQAQAKERETGVPYVLEQTTVSWKGYARPMFVAKPKDGDGRVPNLDHETWMREVWPRVGGPSWRPHR